MSLLTKLTGPALALMITTPAVAQTTTITVTATPSIFASMFERLVGEFEAANADVEIDLVIPPGEQREMIQDVLRRALVDDLPDVTFQGYNFLRVLADRDLPVPLDDFIADDPEWTEDRFAPSVAAAATLGETVQCLGVGISFPVLYYNVDLVRQAQGGDATFPVTWEGVVDLAAQIGASDPSVIGGFHRFHSWMFQAQVESRGGRLMDAGESELIFAGDEGQAAFDLYHAFAEAGQGEFAMTREQGRQAFASGTIGIFTDSSSILRRYEEQVGDAFEIGIAPFPRVDGGTIPAAGVAAVMLAQDEERQAAAWRFMRFVASPEGQVIVAEETAYVPANAAAFAEGTPLADYYAERPLMAAALETVPYASVWYSFPGENSVEIGDVIYDAVEAVATLQIEPQDGLTRLVDDVGALLPQ